MNHLKSFSIFESSSIEVSTFLLDFGMFISMNMSKIEQVTKSDKLSEIDEMRKAIRKPIINGKTYSEIISDMSFIKNPKMLSAVMSQIRLLLIYIEPRIKSFIKDCDIKTNWLNKIEDFKKRYKNIIS